MSPDDPSGLASMRDLAADIVALSAAHLSSRLASDFAVSAKGREDFVTDLDLESDLIIARNLSSVFPAAGQDSEESPSDESPSGLLWVVDPVDGSQNLAYGIPLLGIAVALLDGDRVRLAAVADVTARQIMYADASSGEVFLRQEPERRVQRLSGSAERPSSGRLSLLRGTSMGGADTGYLHALTVLNEHYRRVYETRAPVIDLFMLARGATDALVCLSLEGHETLPVLFLSERLGFEVVSYSAERGQWGIAEHTIVGRRGETDAIARQLGWIA